MIPFIEIYNKSVWAKADCRKTDFSEIDILHFCKSVFVIAQIKILQDSKTLPTCKENFKKSLRTQKAKNPKYRSP